MSSLLVLIFISSRWMSIMSLAYECEFVTMFLFLIGDMFLRIIAPLFSIGVSFVRAIFLVRTNMWCIMHTVLFQNM